jgi:hypothetical protein
MEDTEQGRGPPAAWSRRGLIRALGLTSGGLLLAPPALLGSSAAPAATLATLPSAAIRNPTAPVRAVLELDGQPTYLLSVTGGNAVASIISVPMGLGVGAIPNKHPSGISFEDIVITLPLLAAPSLAGWINDSLTKPPVSKTGVIVYVDADGNAVKQLAFTNAVITEIDLPACDATQMNPAVLVLRLQPEIAQWTGGTGKVQAFPFTPRVGAALVSNFHLSIQGLEGACQRVMLINSLTAKRTVAPLGTLGVVRNPGPEYSAFDISTFSITLAEAYAAPFFAWFSNFTLKGNIGPGAVLPGLLQWLAPDLRTVIATAQLVNLGMVRYAPAPFNSEANAIGRVQIDMYCDAMTLSLPSG